MKKRNIYIFLILLLFFTVSIIYPILSLSQNLDSTAFEALMKSSQLKEAITNSLKVTTLATIISISISYLLAYTISRTNIKHKVLISVLLTLPMLIPSISHGLGIINLFGQNGIITNILKLDFNILGFNGILLGSILYSFPVSFLMFIDAFNYVDNSMYETAKVLGLSKFQTFSKVTFYYMKRPLLSAIFAVFTLIITDYGVPLAVGGRYTTLPLFLYREVIGLLDFSKGTYISMFLLTPALISFIIDIVVKDRDTNNFVKKEYVIENNKFHILLKGFTYFILLFLAVLFGSFLYLSIVSKYPYDTSFSLKHFDYVINKGAVDILINSLIISVLTALIGTIVAYISAYIVSRSNIKIKKVLHILITITLAVPGIVLGLAYMIAFKNTFIYRTFSILIMVNITHFIASPYLMAYNALSKINKNYEDVGSTCGISGFRILKDVIIPNSVDTILEMISYFFINSMITISAVTFLFGTKTMPLSLLINQYEGQMMLEEAAIISLIILIINFTVKLAIYLIKRKRYNNKRGVTC